MQAGFGQIHYVIEIDSFSSYYTFTNATQKHPECKKGEANQKQQLSDYTYD